MAAAQENVQVQDQLIDTDGFEIVEESETKSKILLRLSDKQHERVAMRAAEKKTSINSYILTRLGLRPSEGRQPGRKSKKD